jgi:hypothetical protein
MEQKSVYLENSIKAVKDLIGEVPMPVKIGAAAILFLAGPAIACNCYDGNLEALRGATDIVYQLGNNTGYPHLGLSYQQAFDGLNASSTNATAVDLINKALNHTLKVGETWDSDSARKILENLPYLRR